MNDVNRKFSLKDFIKGLKWNILRVDPVKAIHSIKTKRKQNMES